MKTKTLILNAADYSPERWSGLVTGVALAGLQHALTMLFHYGFIQIHIIGQPNNVIACIFHLAIHPSAPPEAEEAMTNDLEEIYNTFKQTLK